MNLQEMRALDSKTLQEKINLQKKELNRLKVQHAVRPLEDTSRLRKLKNEIAQLLTVLNSQQH